jgi:hypothetical protein
MNVRCYALNVSKRMFWVLRFGDDVINIQRSGFRHLLQKKKAPKQRPPLSITCCILIFTNWYWLTITGMIFIYFVN